MYRSTFLSHLSRDLEFLVHSLSVTTPGYRARVEEMVDAVKQLSLSEVWNARDDDHDANIADGREVLGALRRVARSSVWRSEMC